MMNDLKNNKNLISIIMAAYNAEKTIDAAVGSVINQTYKNWELIIVDDGSSDATGTIAKSYADADPRIRLISNGANMGVSASRKKALDSAAGEWIAILDSDDLWDSSKLAKQITFAESNTAELIFTGSAFIDTDGNAIDWILHVPETIDYRQLLKQNLISNSSVLVRSELYKKYFVMCDDIHEDFALWLLILKDGHMAYGIDEPLLIYRLSESSKTSNKLRSALMNWKTYRYLGLGCFESFYYMSQYTKNGLMKYRNL